MPHIPVRPPFGAAARSKSAVVPICRTLEGLQTLAGFQDQCIDSGILPSAPRPLGPSGQPRYAALSKIAPGDFVNRSATSPALQWLCDGAFCLPCVRDSTSDLRWILETWHYLTGIIENML